MRSLLSKTESRRLKLVELLQHKSDFTEFEELAELFNTSVRILKEDFQELKKLDNIISVSVLPNKVKLDFYQNNGFESIGQYFLHQNFVFKLLEEIFYNENMHHEDLAEKLYVSTSTLYRNFRKIEMVLNENYNLKLQTTPCRITGKEEDIRIFFVTYSSEKYSLFEWPFESIIREDDFEEFVNMIVDMVGLNLDFSYIRYIKYVVFVHLMRYKNGYHTNNEISQARYDLIHQTLNSRDFSRFEKLFGIKITEELIAEIFHVFLQSAIPFSHDELVQKASQSPDISDSYFHVLDMINQLSEKYDTEVPNRDQIILGVHSTLHLGSTELYTHYLINDKKLKFINAAKELYPEFINDLEQLMKKYIMDIHKEENVILLNHMNYTLMTHWDGLLTSLRRNLSKPKVLVISNNDIRHAYMLKDLIEFEFCDQLDITVDKSLKKIMKDINDKNYDMIVSNFPIKDGLHPHVICVENLPTHQDMLVIKENLLTIIDGK